MKGRAQKLITLKGVCLVGPCAETTAHLMCEVHWNAVPKGLRDAIGLTYVLGGGWPDTDATWDLLGKACSEATLAINMPASGPKRRKAKERVRRNPPKKIRDALGKKLEAAPRVPGGPVPKWPFGARLRLRNGKIGPITAVFANFYSVLLCQVVDMGWWKKQGALGGEPSSRDQIFYAIDSETEAGWYLAGEEDADLVEEG